MAEYVNFRFRKENRKAVGPVRLFFARDYGKIKIVTCADTEFVGNSFLKLIETSDEELEDSEKTMKAELLSGDVKYICFEIHGDKSYKPWELKFDFDSKTFDLHFNEV